MQDSNVMELSERITNCAPATDSERTPKASSRITSYLLHRFQVTSTLLKIIFAWTIVETILCMVTLWTKSEQHVENFLYGLWDEETCPQFLEHALYGRIFLSTISSFGILAGISSLATPWVLMNALGIFPLLPVIYSWSGTYVCTLPPVYGRCDENATTRWYYDQRTEECVEFSFSGCGGNKNNFYTESDCKNQCSRRNDQRNERTQAPPVESESICAVPMAYGDCQDNVLSYFYNKEASNCEAFYYSGCGGNGNRFETEEQCERQCGSYRGVDVCHDRVDAGPCDQWQTHYYYNQDVRRCEAFTYGGCGGNGNRFSTESECQSICIAREEPSSNDNKAVCALPVVTGQCSDTQDYHKRWHYDDSRGNCVSFIYSGCAGNQNNFRSFESCTEFCGNLNSNDNNNEIDVRFGDIRTAEPDTCQQYNDACSRLNCPYGISRSYGPEDGCERCECDDPCRSYLCPDDTQCAVDITPDAQLGTAFTAICRKVNKPGRCPTLGNSSRCDRECYNDAHCRGDSKCCVAGCGDICVLPVEASVTSAPEYVQPPTYYPGSQAPQLEDRPQEEIDVIQPEGDLATLRCFATGYPLPTVTWKRGQVTINANQGRYVLTSTGDLQIVQVNRSDSGTYVCVADNGVGAPVEREVKLEIADPVPRKAYILGETNSTKILSLNQPAVVRCLAGGYPKPYVSWWRGNEMVPLSSARHEINGDFSLVIKHLELSDLGPYVCHAYSGEGRPVSMHVTLKAVGPVHVRNREDEQHLKYLVSSSELPITPAPEPLIPGVYVPADCTDNPLFDNCRLIVKAKYCHHKYYLKFCCKSCTLAGKITHNSSNRRY